MKSPIRGRRLKEKVDGYFNILDILKNGPLKPKDMIEKLNISESTFYERIKYLQVRNSIKQLEDGKYALFDFMALENDIENVINGILKGSRPPVAGYNMMAIVAVRTKQNINDKEFQDAFNKVCKKLGMAVMTS